MQGFGNTELTDVERKTATSMRGWTDQLACSEGMNVSTNHSFIKPSTGLHMVKHG